LFFYNTIITHIFHGNNAKTDTLLTFLILFVCFLFKTLDFFYKKSIIKAKTEKEGVNVNICSVTVTRISSIINVYSEEGRYLEIKNRPYYGISFCKNGKIEYVKNGIKTVSDNTCAIILPKGQNYSLFGTKTGEFPLINFDTDQNITDDVLRIPLQNPEAYILEFERLRTSWQNPYGQAKAMSIFYDVLDRMSHEGNNESILLSPALKYVSEHFSESSLSNESLAVAANISEVYLRRLFVKTLRITPKQYILEFRIRQAKQLLSEKAFTVTGIAEKCGFASVYHFCRAFKTITGQTPTEYASTAERTKG